jgi:gas vesicle protein
MPIGERMTHEKNPHNAAGNSFLIGVLAGAAIGCGLGLLLAPRAGAELRRRVGGLSTSLRDGAARRYRQARDGVDETVAELNKSGQEVRETIWNAVARGAQEVEAYATDGKRERDLEFDRPSGRRSSTMRSQDSRDPAL